MQPARAVFTYGLDFKRQLCAVGGRNSIDTNVTTEARESSAVQIYLHEQHRQIDGRDQLYARRNSAVKIQVGGSSWTLSRLSASAAHKCYK
jgi:hypothetical protein